MGLISTMIKTYKSGLLNEQQIKLLQHKKLKKLVSYARKNSKYFEKLYSNLGENFDLKDLPITNKVELMSCFDEWVTDSSANLQKIEEFTSDIENVGHMLNNKYLVFKTSGSTGNPAIVLYDKFAIDVASSVAALRTFARKQDFKAFMKNGKKTAGVFADYGFYLACGMSKYLSLKMPKKKNKITIDVNLPQQEIINRLNEFQPAMLSGYPSNLALLCEYDTFNIKPNVVITGGELLTDKTREKLAKKFNCYVQTHYSCTEVGEIACECSEGHLHVNEDWVIVEPVDKDNRPVGYGVCSDKVLVTNLSNFIQPFIRYELNDRVILHNEKCACGKKSVWLEVEGRSDDILQFENKVEIAPMSFYKILEEVKGVKRFQLVQQSFNKLELRLEAEDKQQVYDVLSEKLQEFLRDNGVSNVEIFLSSSLPCANKVSGKFKHVYKNF